MGIPYDLASAMTKQKDSVIDVSKCNEALWYKSETSARSAINSILLYIPNSFVSFFVFLVSPLPPTINNLTLSILSFISLKV